MDFSSFAEGPLLWSVFLIFLGGIIAKLSFFCICYYKKQQGSQFPMEIYPRYSGTLFCTISWCSYQKTPLRDIAIYLSLVLVCGTRLAC